MNKLFASFLTENFWTSEVKRTTSFRIANIIFNVCCSDGSEWVVNYMHRKTLNTIKTKIPRIRSW